MMQAVAFYARIEIQLVYKTVRPGPLGDIQGFSFLWYLISDLLASFPFQAFIHAGARAHPLIAKEKPLPKLGLIRTIV